MVKTGLIKLLLRTNPYQVKKDKKAVAITFLVIDYITDIKYN